MTDIAGPVVETARAAPLAAPEVFASSDVTYAITQVLFREARLVDEESFQDWLSLIHPEIRYQVFSEQLRMRKDGRFSGSPRVYAMDDSLEDIRLRIAAWESGLQWSANPKERLRHHISNVEVYLSGDDEFHVYSNCWVVRNRRVYDEMTFSYGRKDIWIRDHDGAMLLKRRECDVDSRYIRGKNLAFFL